MLGQDTQVNLAGGLNPLLGGGLDLPGDTEFERETALMYQKLRYR